MTPTKTLKHTLKKEAKILASVNAPVQLSKEIPEPDPGELEGLSAHGEEIQKLHSGTRKEIPPGLWDSCRQCGDVVFVKERRENLNVCPKCGYHYPLTAYERIAMLTDENSFTELFGNLKTVDTLKFHGVDSYASKLEKNKKKTGLEEAVVTGTATLDGRKLAIGVMDFNFLGASMGSVVGEKIVRLTEWATEHSLPLVLATASGGARMYEGMLSLMQMAKTSAALYLHKAARLPYIVIMTNPTYAGVTASFASLGDLIVAEPGAMIGFAGPRVIKETTQSQLPEGFQSAAFLLRKGLIDRIIDRKDLRKELSLLLDYFQKGCILKSTECFVKPKTPPKRVAKTAEKRSEKASTVKKRVSKRSKETT